ncbi:MAG: B12-binding domain-containing radical SAM protein [Planctomycetes bacterium]|nr:B12-binding domain-containing radical SAM protein [Planctomycetota bacterium]
MNRRYAAPVMNVVLLRPQDPLGMVDVLSHVLPTNIGYLAAYVKRDGFDVQIWDYEAEPFEAGAFLDRIRVADPAVVGISCMTPTIINGHRIASLVKQHFPRILTVVGGAHSSALPEETLREFPGFDVVVNQEGEETFREICRHVRDGATLAGIDGTTRREGDGIVREKPRPFLAELDDIPFPARELYHRTSLRYGHSTRGFSNALNTTEIFTSRGCPYKCTFCAIVATFNRSLRLRSPGNVFDEVAEVQKRYGVEHVVIADDTFGLYPGRIPALCEGFRRLGLRSWSCDTRVDCVNPQMLSLMKESGCTKVAFGVETGSPRLIALNQKKIRLDDVRVAVHAARRAGIRHVEANFIVGSHPDETIEDLRMTADLIGDLSLSFVSISVTVPYPGTPNYEIMDREGLVFSKDWSKYVMFGQTPSWRTRHFSAEDLLYHQRRLNRQFYLSPAYLTRTLLSLRSLEDLRYYVKAGRAFVRWVFGGSVVPDMPVAGSS